MKKYACLLLLSTTLSVLHAQNNNSTSLFVRRDTLVLNADECKWIIGETGPVKSVPGAILDAIEKGKLKAVDPMTNKPIPAKDIYIWKMAADSSMTLDENGKTRMAVTQRKHSPDNINHIKTYSDWYIDTATGKLYSTISYIELMEDIYSPMGDIIGHAPLCRIGY